jgi:hypothetical protein
MGIVWMSPSERTKEWAGENFHNSEDFLVFGVGVESEHGMFLAERRKSVTGNLTYFKKQ